MGDTIAIEVRNSGGIVVHQENVAVAALRRPIVVRANPPPRKRDVPLNSSIVIVFSEPVAESTLSSSIRLFRGVVPVPGTVRLLQGTGAEAAFTPAAPLQRGSNYRLIVTRGVRDLSGDALEASLTSAFTTGQTSVGPPASLRISPDTVYLGNVGTTYQLTASVLDSAGNVLTDQPVTWATDNPNGLGISPTGLVTAFAIGYYSVSATSNGLVAGTLVKVTAPPASLELAPTPDTIPAGDTLVLAATVRSAAGDVLFDYPRISWASTAPAVATIPGFTGASPFITVTGVSPGSATISATSGAATGTASILVTPPRPVASVTVAPNSATLLVAATLQLSARLADSGGRRIVGRPIAWSSDDQAVATVDANGLVTAIGVGAANVIATSEGVSDTAAITIATITFGSVSAGMRHSCGLTAAGAAYCWGDNGVGQVGNGSADLVVPAPVPVPGGIAFSNLAAGEIRTCGVAAGGGAYCWGGIPQEVSGALTFSHVVTAGTNTCGLTTTGEAYCWGQNAFGEIGDGSAQSSGTPRAVSGGLTFAALVTGKDYFTCGLTTSGAAYCWGRNEFGQLGDGTTANRTVPVPVLGAQTFVAVVAGYYHACGLTANGDAYCWGNNSLGQLGDGTFIAHLNPVLVSGGHTFTALSAAAGQHTCGLSADGVLRCWGLNSSGQLGTGSLGPVLCPGGTPCSRSPVAVSGGFTFSTVRAGGWHTCGITTAGVLYCWGRNEYGEIGDGSTVDRLLPVKVSGQP
jgi:alpha-tubulin suppressor-like RCC1 family protein